MHLPCGALAGLFGQTLTYPLDVVRRQMQVKKIIIIKLETRFKLCNNFSKSIWVRVTTGGESAAYDGRWQQQTLQEHI